MGSTSICRETGVELCGAALSDWTLISDTGRIVRHAGCSTLCLFLQTIITWSSAHDMIPVRWLRMGFAVPIVIPAPMLLSVNCHSPRKSSRQSASRYLFIYVFTFILFIWHFKEMSDKLDVITPLCVLYNFIVKDNIDDDAARWQFSVSSSRWLNSHFAIE